MNDTSVFYKVVLDDGSYVASYQMLFGLTECYIYSVKVTNTFQKSEIIGIEKHAMLVAKHVKGVVIKYTLTVDSTKHEIIADYRGESNDPQTS